MNLKILKANKESLAACIVKVMEGKELRQAYELIVMCSRQEHFVMKKIKKNILYIKYKKQRDLNMHMANS